MLAPEDVPDTSIVRDGVFETLAENVPDPLAEKVKGAVVGIADEETLVVLVRLTDVLALPVVLVHAETLKEPL